MSPERWKRFKRLVTSALDQERTMWPSFLAAQCGDDVDLFLDASSMLAAGRSMGDFIEAPAWEAPLRKRGSSGAA